MGKDIQKVEAKRVARPKKWKGYFADFGVRRQRKHRLDIKA